MKKASLIMKKLWLEKIKYLEADKLESLCKELKIDYTSMLRYLLARKYLIRIFKGIFYVKSVQEIKFGSRELNHFELVENGLKLKRVENWYFGLYTALKLNKVTHEYFSIDYVINDKIFRAKEIKIDSRKFKFIKIKPLLIFGVKEKNSLRYSELEKTILDFIYLWRYRSIPEEKILVEVSEWVKKASKKKLLHYAKKYPKSVIKVIEMIK